MKAIWKGYLKCSLVTIPIKMFIAITKRPLHFHLYHKACGGYINKENVCPLMGKALDSEEIDQKAISTARTFAGFSPTTSSPRFPSGIPLTETPAGITWVNPELRFEVAF